MEVVPCNPYSEESGRILVEARREICQVLLRLIKDSKWALSELTGLQPFFEAWAEPDSTGECKAWNDIINSLIRFTQVSVRTAESGLHGHHVVYRPEPQLVESHELQEQQ